MSLKGQVAFITGGGKNLGALVATTLAGEGASIAIHYHGLSVATNAESVAADISKRYGVEVRMYQADLTVAANVKNVFSEIVKDFGKQEILRI